MNAPAKLGAYAAVLALVLGAGVVVGAAVGPLGDDKPAQGHQAGTRPMEAGDVPAGLRAGEEGYTLAASDTTFTPGAPEVFTFRITGPDGAPVTGFDVRHERALHLVVVSGDLADYQHAHPTLGADGAWSVELTLARAGAHRAYADFEAAGADPLTLGVELIAAGEPVARPLATATRDVVVDGYEVHLDAQPAAAGADGELHFRVARHGAAVHDLEPYLGAFGHVVAIRASDLAYLHVHPTDDSSPAEVVFAVHAPSPGAYRLFLDFKHEGAVRTAAFTLDVPAADAGPPADDGEPAHGH